MKTPKKNPSKAIAIKAFLFTQWVNVGIIIFVLVATTAVSLPRQVFADMVGHPTEAEQEAVDLMVAAMDNTYAEYGSLPESDLRGPSYSITVPVTAYSSEPEQTDSTPFITASGTHVRHGVVAANFLPIGTRVKIPEIYGDQVFVVEDRMNARYWQRMDIWMEETPAARQFGVKYLTIEVYQ